MVKLLKSIAVIFFSLSIFLLVAFLNLKYLFPSAQSVKTIIKESNVSSLIVTGIRTNLIDSTTFESERLALSDVVNDAVNQVSIEQFTNQVIDQFYSISGDSESLPVITLPFSIFADKIIPSLANREVTIMSVETNHLLEDKKIDIQDNLLYVLAKNMTIIITIFAVTAAFLLLLIIIPEPWPQKFKWLGGAFLLPGLLVAGGAIAYWVGISQSIQENIVASSGLSDPKFLLAAHKILNTILSKQKIYFTLVAVILLVVSVVLFSLSKKLKKKKN